MRSRLNWCGRRTRRSLGLLLLLRLLALPRTGRVSLLHRLRHFGAAATSGSAAWKVEEGEASRSPGAVLRQFVRRLAVRSATLGRDASSCAARVRLAHHYESRDLRNERRVHVGSSCLHTATQSSTLLRYTLQRAKTTEHEAIQTNLILSFSSYERSNLFTKPIQESGISCSAVRRQTNAQTQRMSHPVRSQSLTPSILPIMTHKRRAAQSSNDQGEASYCAVREVVSSNCLSRRRKEATVRRKESRLQIMPLPNAFNQEEATVRRKGESSSRPNPQPRQQYLTAETAGSASHQTTPPNQKPCAAG